jgi:hypothetical protein
MLEPAVSANGKLMKNALYRPERFKPKKIIGLFSERVEAKTGN